MWGPRPAAQTTSVIARSCTLSHQIDRNVLYLRKAFQHRVERKLAPEPALFVAAIGVAGKLPRPLVNLDPPGFDVSRRAQRPADIVRPDVRGQTVMAVVCHPDHLVFVLPRDGDQDRAENFLS